MLIYNYHQNPSRLYILPNDIRKISLSVCVRGLLVPPCCQNTHAKTHPLTQTPTRAHWWGMGGTSNTLQQFCGGHNLAGKNSFCPTDACTHRRAR